MENRSNSTLGIDIVVFWGLAFLLIFWALGVRELWGSEDRWAEISRMMLINGKYFHPEINGEVYFDKPLLSYWFITGLGWLFDSLSEFMVRLPTAISALAGLWGVIWLGSRLWSENVGRLAGWVLLTSYGFLFWARTASADIENLAFIIIAVAWYWAIEKKAGFFSYLIFYLICFTGAETKGLLALVLPILVILPDLIKEKRWHTHLRFSHFAAFVIALGFYLLPFIYASTLQQHTSGGVLQADHENGLYMVFRENIERFLNPFDHKEPFYVYIYYVPLLLAPWILLFAAGFLEEVSSFMNKNKRATGWLCGALVMIFVFFTLSGSRRGYYILPILPFCALLVAVYMDSSLIRDSLRGNCVKIMKVLAIIIGICEAAGVILWMIVESQCGFSAPNSLKLGTTVIGLVTLAVFAVDRYSGPLFSVLTGCEKRLAGLILAISVIMGGFFCFQMPILDSFRTERNFAYELREMLNQKSYSPEELAFYLKVPPNLLYYMNLEKPVKLLKNNAEAEEFIKSGRGVLVSSRGNLKYISSILPAGLEENTALEEKVYPWERTNRASNRHIVWIIDGSQGKDLKGVK